jgi:hypothetical protein
MLSDFPGFGKGPNHERSESDGRTRPAGTPAREPVRLGRRAFLRYPARVHIAYHMVSAPSPIGLLFLARTDAGLRYLEFMDRKSLKRMIASHEEHCPDATWEPSLLKLKPVAEQLEAFLAPAPVRRAARIRSARSSTSSLSALAHPHGESPAPMATPVAWTGRRRPGRLVYNHENPIHHRPLPPRGGRERRLMDMAAGSTASAGFGPSTAQPARRQGDLFAARRRAARRVRRTAHAVLSSGFQAQPDYWPPSRPRTRPAGAALAAVPAAQCDPASR